MDRAVNPSAVVGRLRFFRELALDLSTALQVDTTLLFFFDLSPKVGFEHLGSSSLELNQQEEVSRLSLGEPKKETDCHSLLKGEVGFCGQHARDIRRLAA